MDLLLSICYFVFDAGFDLSAVDKTPPGEQSLKFLKKSLANRAEGFCQYFPRSANPVLDGFGRTMESVGDFEMGKFLIHAKQNRRLEFVGQCVNSLFYQPRHFAVMRVFPRRRAFVRGFGLLGFPLLILGIERHGGMTAFPTEMVAAEIGGNREEPCGEFSTPVETALVLVNARSASLGSEIDQTEWHFKKEKYGKVFNSWHRQRNSLLRQHQNGSLVFKEKEPAVFRWQTLSPHRTNPQVSSMAVSFNADADQPCTTPAHDRPECSRATPESGRNRRWRHHPCNCADRPPAGLLAVAR